MVASHVIWRRIPALWPCGTRDRRDCRWVSSVYRAIGDRGTDRCLGRSEGAERRPAHVPRLQPCCHRLVGQAGQLSGLHRCKPATACRPPSCRVTFVMVCDEAVILCCATADDASRDSSRAARTLEQRRLRPLHWLGFVSGFKVSHVLHRTCIHTVPSSHLWATHCVTGYARMPFKSSSATDPLNYACKHR